MMPLLFSLGLAYFLALGAGRLCAAFGIPRVTGYLLVGLAAGPLMHTVGGPIFISTAQLASLAPLHDIILGLIVFTIGGSFSLEAVRTLGAKRFRISAFEIGLTALLVMGGAGLAGLSPLAAGFLAVMAVTTAPAATQMVMREYRSEGPLSDTILPLIGVNNLAAIVAFTLLEHAGLSAAGSRAAAVVQIGGPFVLGLVAGTIIAVMDQRLSRPVERQILVIAAVALIAGVSTVLGWSAMLATLIAGVVTVNASPYDRRLLEELGEIDYPLYVLFFIMAGAALHLEMLGRMGMAGGVYVVMRVAGKLVGCRVGAVAAGVSRTLRTWLGPAMLAQAGLAIGLAEDLARIWPAEGRAVQTIILASVVVFEVVGPLLTRTALVNAGEVTVFNLLAQHSTVGYGEGLALVLGRFRRALGMAPVADVKYPADMRVEHVMRRNVETISHRAIFDDVVKALGHSRYDRLPVVDDRGELVGVINYTDIANTLFDPFLRHLVVAADIATPPRLTLFPQDTVATAVADLKAHPNDVYLLVVDRANPRRLVGVVRHNDLLAVQSRSSATAP